MSIVSAQEPDDSRPLDAQLKVSSSRALAEQSCFDDKVPDYALLFFDHLHSEYLILKPTIADPQLVSLLEDIYAKRLNCKLAWSDIYTFDLALIDIRPLESLIRKAYDARAKYRTIAGQKEYDEYLASKPPDLTAILIAPKSQAPNQPALAAPVTKPAAPVDPNAVPPVDPNAAAPADPNAVPPVDPNASAPNIAKAAAELSTSGDIIQRVLRADIRYLLNKFYLYYAMLPMRERLREDLTHRAVQMTYRILAIIIVLIGIGFAGAEFLGRFTKFDLKGAFGLTVGSVAFSGILGGCVSMLQRIQSTPSEGDALFNLAALTNGWRGLSLSPLYGGIFASLLFVLFAAGILEGSVFPKINTPGKLLPPTQVEKAESNSAAAPQVGKPAEPSVTPTSTPTPMPTATPPTLQATDFLRGTGPTDGVSFALLIVWSFIAGFAERLVPDTLNRLVAKNEAIQGTNS
jgi:hypothetical protein